MRTFGVADIVNGKKGNPEQMGIIGLGNRGNRPTLPTMGAGDMVQYLGFLFAGSCSEEKYH